MATRLQPIGSLFAEGSPLLANPNTRREEEAELSTGPSVDIGSDRGEVESKDGLVHGTAEKRKKSVYRFDR